MAGRCALATPAFVGALRTTTARLGSSAIEVCAHRSWRQLGSVAAYRWIALIERNRTATTRHKWGATEGRVSRAIPVKADRRTTSAVPPADHLGAFPPEAPERLVAWPDRSHHPWRRGCTVASVAVGLFFEAAWLVHDHDEGAHRMDDRDASNWPDRPARGSDGTRPIALPRTTLSGLMAVLGAVACFELAPSWLRGLGMVWA